MRVDLQVACAIDELPERAQFERWVAAAVGGRKAQAEITVRIVDEDESRTLNRTWRCRDRPANVLSFAAGSPADLPPPLRERALGDLVLCAPLVAGEATAQGKDTTAHWAHLVVHGTLHLLGYDHADDAQAMAMERLETEILARLGYPDPYEPVRGAEPAMETSPAMTRRTDAQT
ncbi:rRNA maturation RNase YbeY [soil metagenome]